SVGSPSAPIPEGFQTVSQRLLNIRIIINHKDSLTKSSHKPLSTLTVASGSCGLCAGMVKEKLLPLPTTLSTPILPPCISTSFFEIAKPSPTPLDLSRPG